MNNICIYNTVMISDMEYVMYTPAFTVDQCGVCNVLHKVQNGAA